jgi:hypothetical protein
MSLNQPSTSAGKRRYEDDIAFSKFNIEWDHQFLFVKGIDSKPVCLICNACITVPKKFNLERHFNQMHPDFSTKYLPHKFRVESRFHKHKENISVESTNIFQGR